jgi:hypothetical protein
MRTGSSQSLTLLSLICSVAAARDNEVMTEKKAVCGKRERKIWRPR